MVLKDWLYRKLLPTVSWTAISLYSSILRIQIVGKRPVDKLIEDGIRIVYTVWHGRQFLVYKTFKKQGICVMSSTSRDGLLQAALLRKFGFTIVFGSSNKSPARALIGVLKKVQEGADCIMAVDGPRGPIYKAKPGAIFLAKKHHCAIVPFTFSADRSWTLNAWDEYMLPKPFSKVIVRFGDPFFPSENASKETIDHDVKRLKKEIDGITLETDRLLGRDDFQYSNTKNE